MQLLFVNFLIFFNKKKLSLLGLHLCPEKLQLYPVYVQVAVLLVLCLSICSIIQIGKFKLKSATLCFQLSSFKLYSKYFVINFAFCCENNLCKFTECHVFFFWFNFYDKIPGIIHVHYSLGSCLASAKCFLSQLFLVLFCSLKKFLVDRDFLRSSFNLWNKSTQFIQTIISGLLINKLNTQ